MKRVMFTMAAVILAAASVCGATVIPINDFEGYADTAALNADWLTTANVTLTLATDAHSGSQSMHFQGNTHNNPWYLKAENRVPGVVWGETGQDWTGTVGLSVWAKPVQSRGHFKVVIVDVYGTNIYVQDFGIVATGDWTEFVCDLTTPDSNGRMISVTEMQRIGRVDIVVARDTGAHGTNEYYIDDIARIVPEPATLTLLGLGGVALLKRRKRA